MKTIRIIISVLIPFFLLIFFVSLITSKPYLILSKGHYKSHEDVYFDHDYAVDRIIGYLNYRYDDLDFGLDENDNSVIMRDVEISHMIDVKNLYTNLRISALVSLIIGLSLSIILYKKNYEQFYKTFKSLYLAPMVFVIFMGVSFVIDFNGAFTIFHKLFFTNDNWLLYNTDVLIILLPLNFWMVSGIIVLGAFSLSLGVIYFVNEHIYRKRILN